MDYLLVVEPRQQGKTSLIHRLMRHDALRDVRFAYIDVTNLDRSSEAAWYDAAYDRICGQLPRPLVALTSPGPPNSSHRWRKFLSEIARAASGSKLRVVIALDEIGAAEFPGSTEFFSVLRDIYNSRQGESEFRSLTFVLAGAFHPRDLIKDARISPFNVAYRIRIPDLSIQQIQQLVGRGPWPEPTAVKLAERIHYWTSGQVYLTQYLCSRLHSNAAPADVDAAVQYLRAHDENHLPPMMDRLRSQPKLSAYVEQILQGRRVLFYPSEDRRHSHLELLGVLGFDEQGYCTIRNRIYEAVLTRVAARLPGNEKHASPVPARDMIFISYSHRDKKWVDELVTMLRPMKQNLAMEVWSDKRIKPGRLWSEEIEEAIRRSKIAVLLVSRHFLDSDFVSTHELPALTHAADSGHLQVFWIACSHCLYEHTDIARFQAANNPARPLDSFRRRADRDRELRRICVLLREAAQANGAEPVEAD
jgi:hypothetical protein